MPRCVYLCADCYGTSALQRREAAKLIPGRNSKFIHVQTEKKIQDDYIGSFNATKGEYDQLLEMDLANPEDRARLKEIIKTRKIRYCFAGMETGAMAADIINEMIDELGLLKPDTANSSATSELRRVKSKAQNAVGEEFAVPTILTANPEEAVQFATSHGFTGSVVKPNAACASNNTYFVPDTNLPLPHYIPGDKPGHLRRHLVEQRATAQQTLRDTIVSILGTRDNFNKVIEQVIVQAMIEDPEYVANTIVFQGRVYLVGLWRYYKINLPGGIHSYFIDVPLDLDSEEALELNQILPTLHARLEHRNGVGHGELFRHHLKKGGTKWYFGEMAARVAGTGIPLVEEQIWGTSHLHLNLLRVMDPDALQEKLKEYPFKKKNDALVVSLIAHADGKFKAGAKARLDQVKHRFIPAPFYDITDGAAFKKTKDLTTMAGTVYLVGPKAEIIESAKEVIHLTVSGEIFDYNCASGIVAQLKSWAEHALHSHRLHKHLQLIE